MSGGDVRRFDRLTRHLPGRRYWSRYRFCSGNTVRLFTAGESYFAALIERIDAAKSDVVPPRAACACA
jgi:cardiolipin synthase